ncbi:MAG: class I SAM-dependent methyltransferase, partial [Leptospiraceae bacterium]|nr:class I SAM-dependent methyltransferase [Leptospiraceae bacterium]
MRKDHNWAEFAEYCYKCGRDTKWNFDGWLGELLFKEGEKWRRRFYAVKDFINESNPKEVIVDLMCGGAYPSRKLAKENKGFFVCIDLNSDYLKFAKYMAKKEKVKEKMDFIRADANNLPLRDKSVDLVFSIGGPEYLPNIKNFLKNVKRICKKHLVFTFTGEKFKENFHYRVG